MASGSNACLRNTCLPVPLSQKKQVGVSSNIILTILTAILSAKSCVLLKIELDPSSTKSNKLEETMRKLDINLSGDSDPTVEASIVETLNYFLYQREKIEAGILDDILPEGVKEAWEAMLAWLEDPGRKLVGIKEGSIVIKIYCPTAESVKELQQLAKSEAMKSAINKFLRSLGKGIPMLHVLRPPGGVHNSFQ